MLILGLESSCDETAAAVVEDGRVCVSSVVASQVEMHGLFGGVVPELASRKHVEAVIPVLDACLRRAGLRLSELDAIAVTAGPGLVGALLVTLSAAKALAAACQKPLYAVHHIAGHIAANYLASDKLSPPFVCLVASGGHSQLVRVDDYCMFQTLGRTRDDAAGEAFDKVARILGLGYPGGPAIDRASEGADPTAYRFNLPRLDGAALDFSFSGLKTQAWLLFQQAEQAAARSGRPLSEHLNVNDFAASFQAAVVGLLSDQLLEAARRSGLKRIALAGGVAANRSLRRRLERSAEEEGLELFCPPPALCTDNAEMIAAAAYFQLKSGAAPATAFLNARASWKLEEACHA